MLYQMRLTNGAIDPVSSGTFVRAGRHRGALDERRISEMTPDAFWKSERTKANYPIGWRVSVPGEQLEFMIRPICQTRSWHSVR